MNNAATGSALLLAAINVAAGAVGHSFAAGDLSFGSPAASSNPNREVEVTYTSNVPAYTGSAVAQYDRIDLTTAFEAANIFSIQLENNFETTEDLVNEINTLYSCGFTAEDFDLTQVIDSGDTTVVLAALPSSLAFKGSLSVELMAPSVPLADAAGNPELGGLVFEPVDPNAGS
jgi:hypothetical protein